MNLNKFIKDLKQIESIFLKCYGKYGKSALVQSSLSSDCEPSFGLTNDGIKILNCMSFSDNHLLVLLVETIRKHSGSCGDNCKTLFIYVVTMLEVLFNVNNQFSNLIDCDEIISTFRTLNSTEVYEEFLDEWMKEDEQLTKIETKENFLSILPNVCVLNDLNNYNRQLSSIAVQLATSLIKSCLYTEEIESNLRELLDDLDFILVYSDKFSLDESKLFKNGFIIESAKLNMVHNGKANGLFLVLNEHNVNKTNTQIEIKSNLNESILNSFYSEKVNYFSKDFLDKLKANNIKIIFTTGCLNDLQKSQLNSIDVAPVSYLDKGLVEFLCKKIGIQPIEIDSIHDDHKQIDNYDALKANLFCLESVLNIESDKINFFSLSKIINLNYVYFCSPIKSNYTQFKLYLIKLIKTFLNGFQNINLVSAYDNKNNGNKINNNLLLIKCSKFEEIAIKLIESLCFNYSNLKNKSKFIIYNYLSKCFRLLDSKLNNNKRANEILYEPFNLKLNCFIKSLLFVQNIIKIDNVYSSKIRITNSKTDQDSDSE